MGRVLRFHATEAQRALAEFREEERSFFLVLDVLKEWKREDLFLRVFRVYRSRMRQLRRLAGLLLDGIESRSAAEELRRFTQGRDRYRQRP